MTIIILYCEQTTAVHILSNYTMLQANCQTYIRHSIIVGVNSQKKLYKCLMFLFESNLNEEPNRNISSPIIVGAIFQKRTYKCLLFLFRAILNEEAPVTI